MTSEYGIEIPEESHYTVYKLTDPDGKIYIGCTGKSVQQRWLNGRGYSRDTPIRKAIVSLGWDAFEKKILCENLTKEGAEKLEKWFIAYYDSSDPEKGYNRFLGGLGKGAHMSEITKKISSEAKNRLYEEKPEVKDKIRDTVNARFAGDPDYRKRVGKGVREAYERDPSIRQRLRDASIRQWQDPVVRERCIEALAAAYVNNPELAEKNREAARKAYRDHPERREEVRRQMQEYLSDPENRAFVDSDSHPKPVMCVETGECYPSQAAAERATGFCSIHKVCLGYRRTCGGYHWRYLTPKESKEPPVLSKNGRFFEYG